MLRQEGFEVERLEPTKLVPQLRSEVPNGQVRDILKHEELWVMRPD
jgi:hypothetical protein